MLRSNGITLKAWLACGLAVIGLVTTVLHAQVSEADKKKRDAFLKAREEMRTVASPTPAEAASPSGKPKAAKKKGKGRKASPEPTKTAAAEKTPTPGDDDEEGTPSARKRKKGASPSPTAKPKTRKLGEEDEDATPRPTSVPRPGAIEQEPPGRGTPVATPPPASTAPFNAPDITIQKSGLEDEQGFEPPPPPPPRRSFFGRLFGGGGSRANYRYLNRGVIDVIRRAPVQRSRWKFIIVHNSGTRQGNARAFEYYHRRVRKMQNGMAYHFVVGNGTSSGNGQIEIGDRWRRQINGGHVHSDYLNNISLGICLVGDFNRDRPTNAQLEATEELIKYLRERCGRVEGRAIPVRPHREMNPPRWATDCPGDAFPYGWFRKF